jgi:hypothetical protein
MPIELDKLPSPERALGKTIGLIVWRLTFVVLLIALFGGVGFGAIEAYWSLTSHAPPPQRTGAAIYVSPNAVGAGINTAKIKGFDNGIVDEGKGTKMKQLDISK